MAMITAAGLSSVYGMGLCPGSDGGKWVIENYGTDPDLEVDSFPDELATGHDLQLDAAITTVLKDLRKHPPRPARVPNPFPPYPLPGDVPPAKFFSTR